MAPRAQAGDEPRSSKRFVPSYMVDASIIDRNLHIVHGMVANLSELGASLLTCRSIEHGSYVGLRLTRRDNGLVDTVARVVWTWDGVSKEKGMSGALVGVSFCGLSAEERSMIWTCSSVPRPRTSRPGRVPFRFDLLTEPEVEWFFAREVSVRNAMAPEAREPEPRTPSAIPPADRSSRP